MAALLLYVGKLRSSTVSGSSSRGRSSDDGVHGCSRTLLERLAAALTAELLQRLIAVLFAAFCVFCAVALAGVVSVWERVGLWAGVTGALPTLTLKPEALTFAALRVTLKVPAALAL